MTCVGCMNAEATTTCGSEDHHCAICQSCRNVMDADGEMPPPVDLVAVEIIDDMEDAQNERSSVSFDWEMFSRARDLILDMVAENQRLTIVLAHRTARLDRLTLAKRGS